jgi:hypothetical protein
MTAGSETLTVGGMNSALASFLGLVFTGIALYGFYWVIRLAVRDGMVDADRRARAAAAGAAGPPPTAAGPTGPPPAAAPPSGAAAAPPAR